MNNELFMKSLSYIFGAMDDAVCVTGKNGALLYINPAAAELFGIPPESYEGKKIFESIPLIQRNDNLVEVFIEALHDTSSSKQKLVEYVNNDKKVSQLWVNITYINEDEGIFVIVISDLTRLMKLNAAFERYTSPQIADFVLNDPKGEKQGGELKEISVLMSDLRGFTAMSADFSPKKMISVLNHYFEKMVSVIDRFGGTVIEFLGDGIFVVFGAPADDPDHASHAVACAVEMQNALDAANQKNLEKGYPELVMEMGIGINSGNAIVGNIGSMKKMKYGVMGYTVNLAGRIESLTIGGQIYVSENTKKLAGEELQINSQNSVLFKGASEPLTVYSVCGIGSYQVKASVQNIQWLPVSPKSELSFYLLDGKAVTDEAHPGSLIAVSLNQHFALLRTDHPLKKSDNIFLDMEIDLYAKVTGMEQEDYVVAFTMRPEGFTEWIRRITV